MSSPAITDLEQAINALSSRDREELLARFKQPDEDAFDKQIQEDFSAGLLDGLIRDALDEAERKGTRPL